MVRFSSRSTMAKIILAVSLCMGGCTSPSEYIHNGFKVGPNYHLPAAEVAEHWIDAGDKRIHDESVDISHWWAVFQDPQLNCLIEEAYNQNLTLRSAGYRILAARATLGIARGEFFPQSQTVDGSYIASRSNAFNSDRLAVSFNMAWEFDFWGRFRRAIASADDSLDASVADYDDILVTLLGDVASNYITIRTDQERIRLLQENVEVQRSIYEIGKRRLGIGTIGDLDVEQAEANLKQTMAQIPQVQIDLRQAEDRLCILLGIPPQDMSKCLGDHKIPHTPSDVVIGIPAELLRRRPDVRRAERTAAAQFEQIGIAEAQWYPAFSLLGSVGFQTPSPGNMLPGRAFTGSIGPSFNWDVLNYGRILNNVRLQDAKFQDLITQFKQTVLQANADVENGLITFLKSQEVARDLNEAVHASKVARDLSFELYDKGLKGFDFNRYAVIQQNLINQQDAQAQARGQIAQGLITVYRSLGGGWEIRCTPPGDITALPLIFLSNPKGTPPGPVINPEEVPAPKPELPAPPAAVDAAAALKFPARR